MKVLRVISSMDPSTGGPVNGITSSIGELENLGISNEIVCLDNPDSDFVVKSKLQIYALGTCSNPWGYNKALKSWLLLNMPRFDAIIVHGLWLYHGYAVYSSLIALKKVGLKMPKLFVMPHGMLDPYFQKAPERRLKAIRNQIYWHLVEKRLINNADAILFTCEEEMLLAKQTFQGYSPKREINIGYGIQAPPTYDIRMSTAFFKCCPNVQGTPYLLYLSRVHPKKGADILVNAYMRLKKGGAILPKLVVAGPGLETYFGRHVQSLASAFPNDILFPGMLNGNEKWGAFYECEAFVLPSHQENFGIAVVEALACGRPVLITDKINIWREIEQDGCGIVGDDTTTGVMNLISAWLAQKNETETSISERAKLCFETRFDISCNAKRITDVLSE